jgi:hypothetical protein
MPTEIHPVIAMLGDSGLENSSWVMDTPNLSVANQLKERFPRDGQVRCFAVDGFTTAEVLKGGEYAKCGSNVPKDNIGATKKGNSYFPLQLIAENQDLTHVILHVGGNDIREKLPKIASGEITIEGIIEKLQANYLQILRRLKEKNPSIKPVIMLQYMISYPNDHYGIYALMNQLAKMKKWGDLNTSEDEKMVISVDQLHKIMQAMFKPILDYAKENKIPVIDMPSSFNHADDSLFVMQIEPSDKGGKIIVDLIEHVVKNHDFEGASKLYSKPYEGDAQDIISNEDHNTWAPYQGLKFRETLKQLNEKLANKGNFNQQQLDALKTLKQLQQSNGLASNVSENIQSLINYIESLTPTETSVDVLNSTIKLVNGDITSDVYRQKVEDIKKNQSANIFKILGGIMLALVAVVAGAFALTGVALVPMIAVSTAATIASIGFFNGSRPSQPSQPELLNLMENVNKP